jgi:hypothetical protein
LVHCPSFRTFAPGPWLGRFFLQASCEIVLIEPEAAMQHPDANTLRQILTDTRVIAVVGISPKPDRPSHEVAQFLQSKGYRIVPVNPGHAGQKILGEVVYADLAAIPKELAVDMVDIFRRPDAVAEVVDDALESLPGLRTVWMQLGVVHEDAARKAEAQGIRVVMDRCPKIDYPRVMPRA